ncbi:MAG: hypothetical protein JNM13_09915, partial [Hyphomicrobiaceae bacterium]|nr:hypothetical protein [Hyphomicrobiaceae bacterium]
LSTSVREISQTVSTSAQIGQEAVRNAVNTVAKVQELSDAASKIGTIIKLISDIAAQTNLLALNATIEAARAGEAGRGFAVVAQEVKQLADQTSKATNEIANQISAIQMATTGSADAIDGISKLIRQMSEFSTAIAAAIEEQGAATDEISRNVQMASRGTQEVTANISGVTRAVGHSRDAASSVLGSADELGGLADRLHGEVTGFLQKVRAA